MTVDVILPKLGFSMDEGLLSEWLIADGGEVKEGEPLFVLESDKSMQEIEAPATGVLKIIVEPGQSYQVGTIIGKIT